MKERLSRKKLSTPLGILVVLGMVAGILIIYAAVFIAADALGLRAYHQYIVFVLLILLGVFIVRKGLTEYEYDVIDDELIIERYIGDRGRGLLRIRIKSISNIGPERPALKKLQRLTYRAKRKGVTYFVYSQNGNEVGAYFSPSPELTALINKRRGVSDQQ